MKIFGEDSFFNKEMATFYKAQDEYVYNEMSMAIKTYMPTVVFDREKLERWVNLCVKLDNIDKSDLIDMATQKKFAELKDQIILTEKALELACKEYSKLYCWHHCSYDKEKAGFVCDCCENGDYKFFKDNFLEQAKEMMKSE